jgi:hypothetical protein
VAFEKCPQTANRAPIQACGLVFLLRRGQDQRTLRPEALKPSAAALAAPLPKTTRQGRFEAERTDTRWPLDRIVDLKAPDP